MNNLRKTLILLLLAFLAVPASLALEFNNESLSYRVMYKWGVVNKQAGHVTLSLHNSHSEYNTLLVAASERWADRFYCVRDTLRGVIVKNGFKPMFYEKIAHEGSDHKHDVVKFTHNGSKVSAKCTRKKYDKKGKLKLNEHRDLSAVGTTVDMLSSFYYMRALPFNTWQQGHLLTINIFSGKRKELLTIKYIGTEKITVDKKSYNTYHVKFTFTGDGGKQTSDDMDAWISTGPQRIPIKLEGKLKVGKVQCFYTGS